MQQLDSYMAEFRESRRLWQEERDQLRSLNVRLTHKDNQYQANMRKKEKEYMKLQNIISGPAGKAGPRSVDITPKPLPPSPHPRGGKMTLDCCHRVARNIITIRVEY